MIWYPIIVGTILASILEVSPAADATIGPVILAPALAHGDLNEATSEQLEASLRDAVRKSDIRIVKVPEKFGHRAGICGDDACRALLIAKFGADFLLVPEVTLNDKDYQMSLTLYAADGGKSARLAETCSLCGLVEAAEVMADLGARMGRKMDLMARAAFVEIRSNPPGAKVFVGSELVGTTPLELPLDAGVHQLRIELAGYIGLRRKVEVVAGDATTLDFNLQELPPKSGRDRGKLFAGLGWAGVGVGVGALIGGATMIGLDERPINSDCSGANIDIEGDCRWRYATLEGGVGFVTGGALLVGTGVALLVVGRRDNVMSSTAARMRPTWGGFAIQF
jgi:hypothetical protein